MAKKQDPAAIYREQERITADLSAWSITKNGEQVARIVVKYGGRRSPNGLTVRAFVHVLGVPMVRGIARGGGYDMKSAAIVSAVQHLDYLDDERSDLAINGNVNAFRSLQDNGHDIPHQLQTMGYVVDRVT